MRAGRGFGMILHGKNRFGLVAETFNGSIVEIDAVHNDVGRKRGWVNCEAVVLSGNFDTAGFKVFHRLIPTPMAKFELEGFRTECLAENLVAEAYAKNRQTGSDQVEDRLHSIT